MAGQQTQHNTRNSSNSRASDRTEGVQFAACLRNYPCSSRRISFPKRLRLKVRSRDSCWPKSCHLWHRTSNVPIRAQQVRLYFYRSGLAGSMGRPIVFMEQSNHSELQLRSGAILRRRNPDGPWWSASCDVQYGRGDRGPSIVLSRKENTHSCIQDGFSLSREQAIQNGSNSRNVRPRHIHRLSNWLDCRGAERRTRQAGKTGLRWI